MNKCKICNHKTIKDKDPKSNIVYYSCLNCGFIQKDPKFFLSSEEEKKRYDLHENSIEDQSYRDYFKSYIGKAILPYAMQKDLALDFGSGPEPVLADVLEKDYGYDCKTYDLYYNDDEDYLNHIYDLICLTEVIEHTASPMDILTSLAKLLKENGVLSIMTSFVPKELSILSDWYYFRDSSHISFFTYKSMEVIQDRLQLQIIYTDQDKITSFKKIKAR